MLDISTIRPGLASLILETGAFIRKEWQSFSSDKIEYKGTNDLVSYVDRTAEEMLVKGCNALIPGSSFINEESGIRTNESPFCWIIDPLDGTTNFIHGLPCFAISVGLMYESEVVLGYVYHVPHDILYAAQKGQGATQNGKVMRVSQAETLAQGLIATGFPYNDFTWKGTYMQILSEMMPQSQGIRRMGSAAIDLVYTACGYFEGFYEFNLNAWDVAAGALIVQEAGGTVTDFMGGNDFLFGKQIVASNGKIHPEMCRIIQQYLTK